MGYILKNTSGLINTRLTDAGRQKLSQGKFNISYFQIGDSEVSYNVIPNFNFTNFNVFEPSFNAQNTAGSPQSNKENIKYPIYVDEISGNTYGIPFMDSIIEPVFNTAAERGFFTGTSIGDTTTYNWSALTNNLYAINSNYVIQMNQLDGSNTIDLIFNSCNPSVVRGFAVGDIITIYYDGSGLVDCNCSNLPTPTPTPTISVTPSTTPSIVITTTTTDPCASATPTPTPSATFCPTPTPSRACPPPPPPNCVVGLTSCFPILTYRIVGICLNTITLDRPLPDFSYLSNDCYARTIIYPPKMTEIYDSITPFRHWNDNVINFESVCYTDQFDVKVWNMNIPWSENPAGLDSSVSNDYTKFGSVNYLGTKEYLGYASSSGQTDSDSVYYFNSFNEIVTLLPEEQKAIGVIHYTNQTVDLFYGEKFALQPFDDTVDDTTGQARNFKLHIPWIMWHKNPECCLGQTFWVDPPGFEDLDLFKVHYLESTKNVDMNNPGIRYFHLWDNNPNVNALIPNTPNRVGKVFPDLKTIIIDDEELIAAMSYKSNRNWTLPAPKVSLITPNICGIDNTSVEGILTGNTEYLYVTYRLSNDYGFTNSLHCNYYQLIQGPNVSCNPIPSQNVAVRFGGEFGCLSPSFPITTTTTTLPPCPCWYDGFTIWVDLGVPNVLIGYPFFNTNQTSNGKPIFYLAAGNDALNIYWNGSNWIINSLLSNDESIITFSGGDEPLGDFSFNLGTPLTGISDCSLYSLFNITVCLSESICNADLAFPYLENDIFNGYFSDGDIIYYDGNDWVYSGNTGILATLSGLNENDTPIGNWTIVGVGVDSISSSTITYGCDCLTLTTQEPCSPCDGSSIVTLVDCYGVIYQISNSFDSPGLNFCNLTVDNNPLWELISGDILDSSICVSACTTTTTLPICSETPITTTTTIFFPTTTTTTCPVTCEIPLGFYAQKFEIICQKVVGNQRPEPTEWKIIDYTDQLSGSSVGGYITQAGLTGNTFVITQDLYDNADSYVLTDYINIPSGTTTNLNFGDEYYFYGNLETDIQATIYEMRYKINLGQSEFLTSSNPTWDSTKKPHITEIGLYDSDKTLMIVSKLQSPYPRTGIQQFLVKFDF